jgi:hypothetical protein
MFFIIPFSSGGESELSGQPKRGTCRGYSVRKDVVRSMIAAPNVLEQEPRKKKETLDLVPFL